MTDDELLAVLGQPAPPAHPPRSTECPVADFIDGNGLIPGKAQSIEMSALYRMYLSGSATPVTPLAFARRVHALKFKTGRTVKANHWTRPIMMNTDSARRMRRWLELNPQPFGWAKEFQSHFWAKGGK